MGLRDDQRARALFGEASAPRVYPTLPWTPDHERAAVRCCYEVAARLLASPGAMHLARRLTPQAAATSISQDALETALLFAGLTAAEVQREVRRVRARAEGRVSLDEPEVFWRVRLADGRYSVGPSGVPSSEIWDAWPFAEHRGAVSEAKDYPGARVVRVTITRRRILRAPAPQPTAAKKGGRA